MSIKVRAMFAIVAALATTGIITIGLPNLVFAQGEQKFAATLSAQEEVPPTNSQATGMAEFTVMGDNVQYSVNASNIQSVTAGAHHNGKKGEKRPKEMKLF